MTSTRWTPEPSRPASSPSSPSPIVTSYAESLPSPTWMRVGSLTSVSAHVLLQSLHDLGCDVVRCPSGGQHSERREPLIRRSPDVHHRDPLRPRVHSQQGPGPVESHPLGGIGDPYVKKHDNVPGQGCRRRRVHHGAAAQRQNTAVGCKRRRGLSPLELAEPRLPLIQEDVRDRQPLLDFDRMVSVAELNAQQRGQSPPDRRLTRSGRAHQNHAGTGDRLDTCVITASVTHHERRLCGIASRSVSYTHLRAHETVLDLVCRLLLEKKKK